MKLKSIELENIHSHEYRRVEFVGGLIMVCGPQGSGKSTLINTIYASLTNDYSRAVSGKDSAIRQLMRPGQVSRSKLVAEHRGAPFELERQLFPTVKSTLTGWGLQTLKKATEIQQALEQGLGVDFQLLNRYVFVKQWEIRELFQQTPAERAKTFAHLCQTTKAEQIWDMLGRQIEQDRALAEGPSVNLDELRQQLSEVDKARAAADKEVKENSSAGLLSDEEVEWVELALESRIESDRLQQRLSKLETEEQTAFADAKISVRDFNKAEKESTAAVAIREAAESSLNAAKLDQAAQSGAIAAFAQKQRLNGVIDSLRAALLIPLPTPPHKESLEEINGHIARLTKLRSPDETILASLKLDPDEANCPTCGQALTDVKQQVQRAEEALSITEEEFNEWYHKRAAMINFDVKSRTAQVEHDSNNLQLVRFEKEWAEVKDAERPDPAPAKVVAAASAAATEANLTATRAVLSKGIAAQKRDKLVGAHQAMKNEIVRIRESVEKIEKEGHGNETRVELESTLAAHKACALVAANLAGKISQIDSQRVCIVSAMKRAESVAARSQNARSWVADLSAAREVFHRDNLPKLVHESALYHLEKDVNATLELFESPFYVKAAAELDYTAHFRNGVVMPSRGLSGGQQVILALAFRWALNLFFASEIGMLILDEPTAGLDPRHIDLLEKALVGLRSAAKERQYQVIIITHETRLERVFDQVIMLDRAVV